jgi:tetratricopeptide (TPR) repeat protein
VLALAAALLSACGGAKKSARYGKPGLPPGLDSSTVARANRFGEQNFVSAKREKEAAKVAVAGKERLQKVDAFWAVLEKPENGNAALTAAQKAEFERATNAGAQSLNKLKALARNGEEPKEALAAKAYCLEAQKFLEEALRLNPFDKNVRLMLATAYYHLQHLFGLEKNYAKAVEILERLVRLDKGEHAVYRLLAENYLELKEYQLALANYRRAEEVMLKLAFMAPPDTAMLFYYNFGQGDALARLHEAPSALKAFDKARPFAKNERDRQDLENYLKWINWDGGNTRSAEQWDKILEWEAEKQYRQVAAACQKLLPAVKTPKARLAVSHKLAVMEFEYLNKQSLAAERMQQVFEALPAAEKEAQREEETKAYLNSYGAMLFRLGVEARKQDQKKTSLAYFSKAASFKWDNVARAGLELLPLVWNSPQESIKYGKLALASSSVLTPSENCQLMSMMIKAYKSAGQFEDARLLFEDWKKCQGEQRAAN